MIRFAEVALGSGGGVGCTRCADEPAVVAFRPVALIAAEIAEAVGAWPADAGAGPNVSLTGSEPFEHPELPAVVAAAGQAGARRIRLETSGAGLQSPGNAAGALSAGVTHVRVTLLGGTPGVHDALTGCPGAFDAAIAGLRTFRACASEAGAHVCVTVRVPACRHNLHDLPAAVAAAVDAGADSVTLAIGDGGADLAPALPWLTAACDTGVVNGSWVEVEGVPFCLLPGYELHVADVLRARSGAKAAACAACAADAVCGGLAPGASADQLALLRPPADADRLAGGVARVRGEARTDG